MGVGNCFLFVQLVHEIIRLGEKNASGLWEVKFGVLFEETANLFEALSGILKTAKKHKVGNGLPRR